MSTTTVKERPILFSSPMVRAILDGRKTQTRRLVKPQPPTGKAIWPCVYSGTGWAIGDDPECGKQSGCSCVPVRCPYEIGMRLWVRETWRPSSVKTETGISRAIEYRADGAKMIASREHVLSVRGGVGGDWRPSIHMPLRFSRITLEITEVRVQRLTEISSEDAIAEGFSGYGAFLDAFYQLNKDQFAYNDDPWVWAITFRRAEL